MTRSKISTAPRHYGDLILPASISNLAPEVAEANRAAIEAHERMAQAGLAARTARSEAEVAPRVDREAEQAAAAAGKPIPRPTAPEKAQAREEAVRELQAHERACTQAIRHLHNTINAQYPDYLERRRKAFEAELGKVSGAVEDVLAQLTAFQIEAAAFEAARAFPQNGSLYAGADPARLPREFEKACERRRSAFGQAAEHVPNRLADLLAALAVQLERLETPVEPERTVIRKGSSAAREPAAA